MVFESPGGVNIADFGILSLHAHHSSSTMGKIVFLLSPVYWLLNVNKAIMVISMIVTLW